MYVKIFRMKIIIIGAGASGIACAINYKRNHPHDDVLIIEHLDKPLKKLLATGNGRCNLGNAKLDLNKYSHPDFVKEVLKDYDYEQFFDSISIKTKLIDVLAYPMSESAVSVRNAFLNEIEKLGIKINVSEKFIDYKVGKNIEVQTDKTIYMADLLFISGALKSYDKLGNDNSVLKILENHNYKVKLPLPGLCPIITKEPTKILDGTRIKCEANLIENNKHVYSENGEVLFKSNGLSGIVIFNLSILIARNPKNTYKISLDLLPNFNEEFIQNYCKSHTFDGFLQAFFNPKIIQYLKERYRDENAILKAVKNLEFTFGDFYDFEFSQISVGGIDISNVNIDLSSKLEKGVYLLGELLDIDAPCGGYNLTWAFASGLRASK